MRIFFDIFNTDKRIIGRKDKLKSFIELILEFVAGFFEFFMRRPKLVQGVLGIVIFIVLVKVAFNFFNDNRIDAQVAMTRTDLANALRKVQTEVYSRNLMVAEGMTPLDYKSWGDFIIDVSGLDKTRWRATEFGIRVVTRVKGGMLECKGDYFYIDTKEGKLIFAPSKITNEIAFCKELKESYKDKDSEINLQAYSNMQL